MPMMKAYQQLLTIVFAILTAAQDHLNVPNPTVDLSSCQDLSCSPPNGSICAPGDRPGPEIGVGIAANAVNASGINISLTLIDGLNENGFTGMASADYEHSDQQLFVGIDPDLDYDDYPSGCVLMMQYQGQTFPIESSGMGTNNDREELYKNTTSCSGVVDPFCQSAIVNMIQSFNNTPGAEGEGESDRCQLLTQHVNMRLQGDSSTCGGEGTLIANFINVTGGHLPGPNTTTASNDDRLGNDQCRAVLPQPYELYKVAVMRQLHFSGLPELGSEFYSRMFGGRAGFTPVITVVYDEGTSTWTDADVQFSCMQTFERDGDPRENQLESGAAAGSKVASLLLTVLLPMGVVFAL